MTDYFKNVDCAVTICDTECVIIYQNEKSIAVNGDMLGRCMLECHNNRSRDIISRILTKGISNSYTISKNGLRKLIHQTPWYQAGQVAGIIELSVIIPEEMPHYDRN